jgi:hypothetical protein
MSDKIVVRFLKAWRGYSADELAGFDPDVVDGLKTKGFAEVYEKPKAGKAATKSNGAKGAGEAGAANSSTEPSGTATGAEDGGDNAGTDDDAKP